MCVVCVGALSWLKAQAKETKRTLVCVHATLLMTPESRASHITLVLKNPAAGAGDLRDRG